MSACFVNSIILLTVDLPSKEVGFYRDIIEYITLSFALIRRPKDPKSTSSPSFDFKISPIDCQMLVKADWIV